MIIYVKDQTASGWEIRNDYLLLKEYSNEGPPFEIEAWFGADYIFINHQTEILNAPLNWILV